MTTHVPAATATRLHEGERVEWVGQPRQGFFFRGRDVLFGASGLCAAAFGTWVFISFTVRRATLDLPALFGVLVFAFGQYTLWGRFLFDRALRAGMFYAVTDRRCLIVSTRFRRICRTFPRRHPGFRLETYESELGTVWIDPDWRYSTPRSLYHWFSCFEQITGAQTVFAMLRTDAPVASPRHIDPLIADNRPETRKSPGTGPGLL